MSGQFYLIWGATFTSIAALTYGLMVFYRHRRTMKERIKNPGSHAAVPLIRREESTIKKRFMDWISSFGKYALKDKEDGSKSRMLLVQAGFRHPKGPAVYQGIRVLLATFLPLVYLLAITIEGEVSSSNLALALLLAGGGFYLPQYILTLKTRRRQDRMDKALPDVLDLFIVCMEAGMSLQATINRVSEETLPLSKELYEELMLTNAELRTGLSRDMALKNMGERTGVQNIKSLVGLMIQSDRMGASIAQSLRTHASFLRVQRGQKAEEHAAKLPVKILFPVIFFIFPSIFIVVLGPAIIQLSKSSFFGG
jgi:tight adherence protein C